MECINFYGEVQTMKKEKSKTLFLHHFKKSKKVSKKKQTLKPHKQDDANILAVRSYIKKKKRTSQKEKTYLIFMFMRNGTARLEWLTTREETFTYEDGNYVIDSGLALYEKHNNSTLLMYHQDISLPLHIQIDVQQFYDLINKHTGIQKPEDINYHMLAKDNTLITYNIMPRVLKHLLNADVIKKIIQGEKMTDVLMLVKMLLIYCAIAVSISVLASIVMLFLLSGVV